MAQLVVRNLPEDVKARLRRRATRHGRSLEAEVRDILSRVPEPQPLPSEDDDWTRAFTERIRRSGVTSHDVEALREGIASLRGEWRLRDVLEQK